MLLDLQGKIMYQIDVQFNQVNSDSQWFTGEESRCIKSVRIRSFFGPYLELMRNDQKNFECGHLSRNLIVYLQSHCLFVVSHIT